MQQQINCTHWESEKLLELFTMLRQNENITIIFSFDQKEEEMQTEKLVGTYLHRLGIPFHLQGYNYIKYAITRCIQYPEELECITKILYPNIAGKYQTTSGKVEHSIRHAITKAWEQKEEETWQNIFGYTQRKLCTKPTNSQFIAAIVDFISLNN